MSCCGSKRQQVAASASAASGAASAAAPSLNAARGPGPLGVTFVYDGVAGLIVSGRVTGRRYRFTERGARLVVDPLDAPHFDGTPKLRRA
jgi:hypothetical protein